jgi:F0F1-type ATP synthase assembly protein I
MKKTTVSETTPSPNLKASPPQTSTDADKSPSQIFVSTALDMSWRLAIVVLVPIIGGFKLDEVLHMTPLLTIIGFILAMGGVALVLWQMLQTVNKMPVPAPKKKEKRQ